MLIDLTVQGSIVKDLAHEKHIKFYDLDTLSEDLDEAREQRFLAIDEVNNIITNELVDYCRWLQEAPLRQVLAEYKIKVTKKVVNYFEPDTEVEKIKEVTHQIMRKLMHQPEKLMSSAEINSFISEYIESLNEMQV